MTQSDVNRIQQHFERLFQEGVKPWTEHAMEPEIPAFADRLLDKRQTPQVLDIGCGNGWIGLYLASRGIQVSGIDSSSTAIEEAKRLAQEAELSSRVAFEVGDGLALPYEEESFDGIIDRGFFHHVPEDEYARYLQQVSRVLRPHGWLSLHAFTMRNREGIGHRFDVDDIERIFKTHFEMVEHSEDSWPTEAPAHLGHYLLRKR